MFFNGAIFITSPFAGFPTLSHCMAAKRGIENAAPTLNPSSLSPFLAIRKLWEKLQRFLISTKKKKKNKSKEKKLSNLGSSDSSLGLERWGTSG